MLDIATFDSQYTKSIAKAFANQAAEAISMSVMTKVFDVKDTTEYVESFISSEASNQVDWVDEGANYNESAVEKGYKTAFESAEFGHKLVVTKKARNKFQDSTEKVLRLFNQQKNAGIRMLHQFIEKNTTAIFNEAFSSTTYLAPDGLSLVNSNHTRNSSALTWSNRLTAGALDSSKVDELEKKAGDFKDATGDQFPLNFMYVMVKKGGSASRAALKLFARQNPQGQYSPTTIAGINIYEGSYMVIENPWMTGDTDYFFLADNVDRSVFVNFIERPRIQNRIKERENLDRYTLAGGSMKYGINNQPFDIIGGKV